MSEDYGKHFTGVEDLIQKHMLVEADIQAQSERVKQAIAAGDDFLNMPPGDDGIFCFFYSLYLLFLSITVSFPHHLYLLRLKIGFFVGNCQQYF